MWSFRPRTLCQSERQSKPIAREHQEACQYVMQRDAVLYVVHKDDKKMRMAICSFLCRALLAADVEEVPLLLVATQAGWYTGSGVVLSTGALDTSTTTTTFAGEFTRAFSEAFARVTGSKSWLSCYGS